MTDVPHLVTLPRLELIEAGDLEANITDTLLANRTGYRVSETFNPLTTLDAGQQYFCRAQLEIESVDVYLRSQSDPYTVTVQSKSSVIPLFGNAPSSKSHFLVIEKLYIVAPIHQCSTQCNSK